MLSVLRTKQENMSVSNNVLKPDSFMPTARRASRVWLVVILLVGLFLRVYRFSDFMEIDGDHARDILVAKHIVEFDEGFRTAPYAFGAGGLINNSPVFYWILAGMWLVSRSALGMGMFFALTNAAAIGLAYGAGLLMGGIRTGLIFSFFIGISSLLIRDAHGICQTCFMPVNTLISLFFMALFALKSSHWSMIAFVTSLFFGVHIHQSFLPFFVVGLVWVAWRYIRSPRRAIIFFTIISVHVFLWALVTKNDIHVVRRYFDLVAVQGGTFSFLTFPLRAWQSVYTLIPQFPGSVSWVYLGVVIALFLLAFRTRTGKKWTPDMLALFAVILMYGVYRQEGGAPLPAHYLKVASVVFLFILSYYSAVFVRNRAILLGFVGVTGILLGAGNMRYFGPAGGNYKDHYQVTVRALEDAPTKFYANYLSDRPDSWRYIGNASPQWLFLEDIRKTKIVAIEEGANSFSLPPIEPDAVIYLTCINNLGSQWENEMSYRVKCIDPFVSQFSQQLGNRFLSQLPPLYGQNGHTYRMYRYAP